MNNKSLWDLSKLNVRRNKAVKKTMQMFTLSFVLLFFIIWMAIGFFGVVLWNTQTDKENLIVYFEKDVDIDQYNDARIFLNNFDSLNSYGIRFGSFENKTCEENFFINGNKLNLSKSMTEYTGTLNTNTVQYSDNSYSNIVNYLTGVQILSSDSDINNSIMKDMELKGSFFDKTSKSQILVSDRFLEFAKLSASEILNQKISLNLEYKNLDDLKCKLDNDTIVGNEVTNIYNDLSIDIFKNYKIVGIFHDNWLQYNFDCDFIITEQSINFNNFPTIHDKTYTYSQADCELLSQNITNNGDFFPFMLNNTYISPWVQGIIGDSVIPYPPQLQTIQLNNFNNALQLSEKLDDLYSVSVFKPEVLNIISIYNIISKYFGIITIIAITLFGVILLNFYNINTFSKKEKEKSYIVYRALGLNKRNICKLDFYQNFRIFGKSLILATICVIVVIGILSVGMLIFGQYLNGSKYVWQLIACFPLALAVLGIIAFFCSYLFSQKYLLKIERKYEKVN